MLVAALGFSVAPASAATVSGQFNVTVALAGSAAGFCSSGPGDATFGTIVTVVCATGAWVNTRAPGATVPWAPIHGGAYRFIRLTNHELPLTGIHGGIDTFLGVGTVTSWRLVSLADRDYLEMLTGW